jgi:hypothetical protein
VNDADFKGKALPVKSVAAFYLLKNAAGRTPMQPSYVRELDR